MESEIDLHLDLNKSSPETGEDASGGHRNLIKSPSGQPRHLARTLLIGGQRFTGIKF